MRTGNFYEEDERTEDLLSKFDSSGDKVVTLDPDDIAALLEIDKRTGKTIFELRQCQHCGGVHDRACPRVKRMSFTPSGGLAEVEFWDSWDATNVIFPEMLGVIEDDDGG